MADRIRADIAARRNSGGWTNRPISIAVAVSAVLSIGLLGACSGESAGTAPQPSTATQSSAQSSAQPSGDASSQQSGAADDSSKPDSKTTAKPSPPPAPKAPATVEPVKRTGTSSTKRISGSSASFSQAIRWSDGVQLKVVGIKHAVTDGVGPGASQGDPMTTFQLELTNDSGKPVDVSSVVLTTVYGGKSKLVAQPVYGQGATDFSGTVAPGKTATASYAYSIPSKQLGAVTVTVDLDGKHGLASFHGSAR